MPLEQSYFVPAPDFYDGTIVDIDKREVAVPDRSTPDSEETVMEDRIVVEVQSLRNPDFIREERYRLSNHRQSKWIRWLNMFKDIGVEVESANDLIGRSFQLEIVTFSFKNQSGETIEYSMMVPRKEFSEEEIEAIRMKAADLSEEEQRALSLVKVVLQGRDEMDYNEFLSVVFSDPVVRDDEAVRDIVTEEGALSELPGITIEDNVLHYSS